MPDGSCQPCNDENWSVGRRRDGTVWRVLCAAAVPLCPLAFLPQPRPSAPGPACSLFCNGDRSVCSKLDDLDQACMSGYFLDGVACKA